MQRFEGTWRAWDAHARAGERAVDLLLRLSDESLIELLASAGDGRRYERNLIATEILNRMRWLRRELSETASLADEAVEESRRAAAAAAQSVHESEAENLEHGAAHAARVAAAQEAIVDAADAGAGAVRAVAGEVREEESQHVEEGRAHAGAVAAAQDSVAHALDRLDDVEGRIGALRDRVLERARPEDVADEP